ncbi:CoA ester lyase [Novosphingobium sp. Gsoil 351]|uniref:HpcH/HpaI aldolase/citrate lyase family protein n=1 Tax=Novosphingobium sp. Gsoil 351 TaxID=2675225 RepID=UPI0012B4E5F9|nr:CoA ester lyase [Novosphingobium sp. Gsoil 351]QGN55723.1 CoA ester lyase [Novosphingobium sp. Gsoil 351]
MNTYRPRRSALYVPASSANALIKARALPVDVVIVDLEDAVAPEMKDQARAAAADVLQAGDFGPRALVLRVNGIDTPWGSGDLALAAAGGADAVLVPKIDCPEDLDAYADRLRAAQPKIQLWAMVETCRCIPALPAIAARASDTQLRAFVMGTNDLAKEMRARLTPARTPFHAALSATVQAARAWGLAVLDGVCNEFRDEAVFRAEACQGAEFGFDGKTLIHPAQIAACNEVFSPGADEIAWAAAVIEAFELPENAGKGAISVDGRMTELLHLEQARRVRDIATAISVQR